MTERWAIKSELCSVLGISGPTLQRIIEVLPPEARRPVAGSRCGKMEFLESACVRVRQQQLAEQATAKALRKKAAAELKRATTEADEADPLMQGVRSPNLERYRGYRADREKLELERARGDLVPSADLQSLISRGAARLRQAGQELQRLYGPDAQAILDAAIDDIARMDIPAPAGGSKKKE